MKNHFAEGLDASAKEKFDEHVMRVAEKRSNGRGMLEYAAVQDFNPMVAKAFAMRYACRQKGMWLHPEVGGGLDYWNATEFQEEGALVLRGVRRRVQVRLGGRRPRLERPG